MGFSYAREEARQIIQEQMRAGENALPWSDREAYTKLMLQRSIESYCEHKAASRPVFFDRGIPDVLCYARLIGLRETHCIEEACRQYRYAPIVFLAPPWEEIYRTDNERKQDFIEAGRTFRQMAEVYRELGYESAELPRTTPGERAQFMVKRLGLSASSATPGASRRLGLF